MPYSQIISLMIAMTLVAGAPVIDSSSLDISAFLLFWSIKTCAWWLLSDFCIRRPGRADLIRKQSTAETLQWAALFPLAVDYYLLDMKFFSGSLLAMDASGATMDIIGLLLFIFYMGIVWYHLWAALHDINVISKRFSEELSFRLRMLLPALIPFLAVSALMDLVSFLSGSDVIDTVYGEAAVIALFIIIFIFATPSMIRWIWRCSPLPDGALRRRIYAFTSRENLRFADFLVWPLDSGMCTAAVVGIVPAFRYIMITPCLMEHLSDEEIEAVLAHECAHVKKRHMLWYLFFVAAYSLVVYRLFDLIWAFAGSSRYFMGLLMDLSRSPAVASLFTILPLAIAMALYFRFIVGYFMRNFERQADLAVFSVHPHPFHLVNALEKVAILAGNIRQKPNWHHFSIAERVEFLQHAAVRRSLVKGHDMILKKRIIAFVIVSALVALMPSLLPVDRWHREMKGNIIEISLEQMAGHEIRSIEWYMAAGLMFAKYHRYLEAAACYEMAMKLAPDAPDVLNNYAWLLLTADDASFRNGDRALDLAERAVELDPDSGYILDTLALAWFVNGDIEQAVMYERKAMQADPENRGYYARQLKRFMRDKVKR